MHLISSDSETIMISSRHIRKLAAIAIAVALSGTAHAETHFEFTTGYKGVDEACSWAEKHLQADAVPAGVDPDFVMMCLREALLNAVEHGNHQNPEAFVDLTLHINPGQLRLDISDEGCGFDLAGKIAEMKTLDGFQLGRRGLPLMYRCADRLEVHGGTVTMQFNPKT